MKYIGESLLHFIQRGKENMTTTRTTTSSSHLSLAKKGLKQKSASLPRRDRSNTKPSLEGVKVSRSSSHRRRRDETTTGKSNTNDQRRRVLFLGMTTAVLLSAEKAKAFTVGGENLPSGSTFPSSNEKFFNDEDEEEERYTTKDLVLDFVSPIVALRVVNIAFNGGMGGSPKWLDYLCVASVGVVLWVFATDYSGLDAALH
ncbi:hypothetical protein N9D57_01990 [bacterium]|nr:hypothetical protein [bacterium]